METVAASTRSKRSNLDRQVYTLSEFAKLCGCSYTQFHERAQSGTLPLEPIRIGRRYLFAKSAVHRLLGIEPGVSEDAA